MAVTPSDLGLPTHGLDRLGERCAAAVPVPTALGRVASGPGAWHQSPTGRGSPGLREAARAAALAPGRGRRRQAQSRHAWSGVSDAGQVAACRDGRDRPRPRHATAGWQRLNDRAEPPRGARLRACRCQAREPVRVCGARPAIVLADAWRGGGGQTTALRQRRGAGPHVARPGERLSGRRSTALRRHVAVWRACRVAARARLRSRLAAAGPAGTETGGRSPERMRRATGMASRRAVWTRSPGCCGSTAGATTPPPGPWGVSSRASPEPPGPASETKTSGVRLDRRCRRRWSRAPCRVPTGPRALTSAPSAGATEATAMDS